jgi:serine/threonine protein phosphatase PrpC
MLDIEFAQLTDVGRVRDHNEDFLGHVIPATPAEAQTHGWLFVLADGVGGQEKGEVASQTAVEHMVAGFRNAPAGQAHPALMARLMQDANLAVYEAAIAGRSSTAGMATTMVACALRHDRVTVAHVGDSRCYIFRRGEAVVLTRDHTFSSEQVRLGIVSAQEAAAGVTSHILSRAMGTEMVVNADISDHQVFPGDVLLLCSDGLHGSVNGSEMAAVCVHGGDLHSAAHRLVELAKDRDGSDNISIHLIRVRAVERMGMYRGRPYKLP